MLRSRSRPGACDCEREGEGWGWGGGALEQVCLFVCTFSFLPVFNLFFFGLHTIVVWCSFLPRFYIWFYIWLYTWDPQNGLDHFCFFVETIVMVFSLLYQLEPFFLSTVDLQLINPREWGVFPSIFEGEHPLLIGQVY